jgi:hypothetical protein
MKRYCNEIVSVLWYKNILSVFVQTKIKFKLKLYYLYINIFARVISKHKLSIHKNKFSFSRRTQTVYKDMHAIVILELYSPWAF